MARGLPPCPSGEPPGPCSPRAGGGSSEPRWPPPPPPPHGSKTAAPPAGGQAPPLSRARNVRWPRLPAVPPPWLCRGSPAPPVCPAFPLSPRPFCALIGQLSAAGPAPSTALPRQGVSVLRAGAVSSRGAPGLSRYRAGVPRGGGLAAARRGWVRGPRDTGGCVQLAWRACVCSSGGLAVPQVSQSSKGVRLLEQLLGDRAPQESNHVPENIIQMLLEQQFPLNQAISRAKEELDIPSTKTWGDGFLSQCA
ncbi:uncharacterized protein [Heliangelus exortis]|uniref:uncharacterized protein n=1 Tax=Heliangelus exortis TaxID=472823 RepID=UPI003A8CDD46